MTKVEKIEAIILDYYQHDLERFETLSALEIGCGGGFLIDHLSQQLAESVGVDIDLTALSFARQSKEGSVAYMAADGMNLPFMDEVFDLVVCNHVYEHLPDPYIMFSEVRRVLREAGVCYFAAGNRLGLYDVQRRIPFLSWFPERMAASIVHLLRPGMSYREWLLTPWSLRELTKEFTMHDYTLRVLKEPEKFHAEDMLRSGGARHRLMRMLGKLLYFFIPTYLWVLEKTEDRAHAG